MTEITQDTQTTQHKHEPVALEKPRPNRQRPLRKPPVRKNSRLIQLIALSVAGAVAAILAAGILTGSDNPQSAPAPDALDRYLANHPQPAAEPDALDRYLANHPQPAPEPDVLDRYLANRGSNT